MAYRNRVELIGRLGSDPEVVELNKGIAVNISIATTKMYREDGEPKQHTEWHDVSIYGQSAKFAAEYCVKGMLVSVVASLRKRKYQNSENKMVNVMEIVVNDRGHEIQVLSWPEQPQKSDSSSTAKSSNKHKSQGQKNHGTSGSKNRQDKANKNEVDVSQYAPLPEDWDPDEPF